MAELKWTKEALLSVLQQYRKGETKASIARKLGVSRAMAGHIIKSAEEINFSCPHTLLGNRARNCLIGAGINTAELLQKAISEGALDKINNLGAISKAEILKVMCEFVKAKDTNE